MPFAISTFAYSATSAVKFFYFISYRLFATLGDGERGNHPFRLEGRWEALSVRILGLKAKMGWQAYHTVWVLSASGWMSLYMVRMIFTPSLPFIIEEYEITYTQAGTVASAVFWAYVPMMLLSGYLGDHLGRKSVLVVGILSWSLTCLFTPLAFSLGALLFMRFLTGLTEGTYFGNDRAMLTAYTSPQRWGMAQGFTMAGTGLGNFLALLLGGIIAGAWGWRYIFIIVGLGSLIIALLFLRFLPNPKPSVSVKAKSPGGSLHRVLYRRDLLIMYLIGFVIMDVFWVFGVWIPSIFLELGVRSQMAASIYGSVFGLGGIPGMLLLGLASDFFLQKWGITRKMALVFSLFLSAAFLLVGGLYFRQGMELYLFMILVGAVGFFITGLWPPLYAMIAQASPPQYLGTVFGLSNSVAFLGAILAPILAGLIKDQTQSFAWTFYLGVLFLGIAALLTLFIPSSKKSPVIDDSST